MSKSFRDYEWALAYKTSALNKDGNPTDILREFYLPALDRAVKYDRVAGYFRSSSLAAASEGYTAFLNHDGRMRLIVGADLSEEDIQAILKGDEARLSNVLSSALDGSEAWDAHTLDGVTLLSSMVASGKLEVRVAVRLNSKTGELMGWDAEPGDGYVHEKWFIMEDAEGNRMSGDGSLNESKTALVINSENISLNLAWEGGNDKKRVDNASRDYNLLWNNQTPHMRVYSLPEAIKKKLVRFSENFTHFREIDGSTASDQPSLTEALRFAVLRDAPKMPGGRYLGIYSAPITPWPHQEIVSRRLVETWPYSFLMCDEVGLGKTIEAALAIRALYLSGRVKRVLIIAPASLTQQWQRELMDKASLSFARTAASPRIVHTYPDGTECADSQLYSPDLNIISSGLMARKERLAQLEQAENFDIVLLDESHYARRKNPKDGSVGAPTYGQLYRVINDVIRRKTKSLWMATATPMQIDPVEVYDLIRLTNRVALYKYDPTLAMHYFDIMGKIIGKRKVTREEWAFVGQSFLQLQASDPYLWNQLKSTCVDAKNRKVLDKLPVEDPKNADWKYLPRPLFSSSPLSRVMMRHTRSLLELYKQHGELNSTLAKRQVEPVIAIKFTKSESEFYDLLSTYCTELQKQIARANPNTRQMMFFYLSFLQLRFASSTFAAQKTLQRRLKRVQNTLLVGARKFADKEEFEEYLEQLREDSDEGLNENDYDDLAFDQLLQERSKDDLEWEEAFLRQMLRKIEGMSRDPSKIRELLTILERRRIPGTARLQQTVLFTRFLDSLENIRQYLRTRQSDLRVGVFSGQYASYYSEELRKDIGSSREEIKRLFLAGEIDLLLCTDAAAEGLNLQTADLLINYDMGWNPMKIEQRIGRIDRIGQKHDVIDVMNLCYLGSAEETVYGRLLSRLTKANLVVGAQQISMLPVTQEDFRGLQLGTVTEKEVEEKARERLKVQKETNARMELSPEEQYEMYRRLSKHNSSEEASADLGDVWDTVSNSPYLLNHGMTVVDDDTVSLSESDSSETHWTVNRSKTSDRARFLTWDDKGNSPLNTGEDRIADASDHIIRLEEQSADGWTQVGYLVSAKSVGAVLITRAEEARHIEVDPSHKLTLDEIDAGREELKKRIATEAIKHPAVNGIEERNEYYAKLHRTFVSRIAAAMLQAQKAKGSVQFWAAIREIEQAKIISVEIPSDGIAGHENELAFAASTFGDKTAVPVTPLLKQSAVEYASRIANQMKVKKSELTIDQVMAGIRQKK